MEFIAKMQAALLTSIREVMKREPVAVAASLSEMEITVKAMLHEGGNAILSQWLEAQDGKYPADTQACECGAQAEYVRRRAGVSLTLLGRVRYRRAYYVCPQCHIGHYPLDRLWWPKISSEAVGAEKGVR